MKKIKLFILTAFVALGIGAIFIPQTAGAISALPQCDTDTSLSSGDDANSICAKKDDQANSYISDIIQLLLYIIGILSVIMLIFGGIRYVTSAGDSGKVTSAKNTILYAIIGLVIALVASIIVHFVLDATLQGGSVADLTNAKNTASLAAANEKSATRALQDAQADYVKAVQAQADNPSDSNAALVVAKAKLVDTAQAAEQKTAKALQDANAAEAAAQAKVDKTKK